MMNEEISVRWVAGFSRIVRVTLILFSSLFLFSACNKNSDPTAETPKQLRAAAEKGDAKAMNRLAFLLVSETPDGKPDQESLKWLHQAADKGNKEACYNLGVLYDSGNGVPENSQKSFDYYFRAAKKGLMDAQVVLGLKYEKGEGVGENLYDAQLLVHQGGDLRQRFQKRRTGLR